MDNEEMLRCLNVVADYFDKIEGSPLAAKDLREIRTALKKAWEDAEYWEDTWNEDYDNNC